MQDVAERATGLDEWLPTTDVASMMHVSKFTIERMIKAGDLVATRFRGSLRVSRNSVDAYILAHLIQSEHQPT